MLRETHSYPTGRRCGTTDSWPQCGPSALPMAQALVVLMAAVPLSLVVATATENQGQVQRKTPAIK